MDWKAASRRSWWCRGLLDLLEKPLPWEGLPLSPWSLGHVSCPGDRWLHAAWQVPLPPFLVPSRSESTPSHQTAFLLVLSQDRFLDAFGVCGGQALVTTPPGITKESFVGRSWAPANSLWMAGVPSGMFLFRQPPPPTCIHSIQDKLGPCADNGAI